MKMNRMAIGREMEKRLEYEAREKAILDYNQHILEAREEGERLGEVRGEARGEERGETRINKLNDSLIQDSRFEDLKRAARDRDFQKKLMLEYGI